MLHNNCSLGKLFLSASLLALTACGAAGSGGGDNKNNNESKGDTPADNKSSYTDTELLSLSGSTQFDSRNGQSRCSDVLANGIYNRYRNNLSESQVARLKRHACSLSESDLANKVKTYRNRESSSNQQSSSSGDTGIDFEYVATLGFDQSSSDSSASSSSEKLTDAQALSLVTSWRAKNCGGLEQATSQDIAHEVISEEIDKDLIDAWKTCVTKAQNGFFCSSQTEGDLVSVKLSWLPNDLQKKLLPQLTLSWQAQHNLDKVSTTFPETLGTGDGISVSFARKDIHKASLVEVNGHDPQNKVNFSCSLLVPAIIETVKRHPSCGIESYQSGSGAVCGAKTFKASTGPVCGAPIYKNAATLACGVQAYQQMTSIACPGSIAEDSINKEDIFKMGNIPSPLPCPSGYNASPAQSMTLLGPFDLRFRVKWQCQRPANLKTCRLPAFGVESYKTCRNVSHGIDGYPSCRDASFGVETYETCKHESFGVIYNECVVPKTAL